MVDAGWSTCLTQYIATALPGAVPIARTDGDDPVILETWT